MSFGISGHPYPLGTIPSLFLFQKPIAFQTRLQPGWVASPTVNCVHDSDIELHEWETGSVQILLRVYHAIPLSCSRDPPWTQYRVLVAVLILTYAMERGLP